MSCFFGCFRAKDQHHLQPPFAATTKARVSRNQLSDVFVSQEIEELSYHDMSTQSKSVDIQCKDTKTSKVVDSNRQPVQPWTPAKPSELEKGLDSLEETPTSCISDPPNATRNSVSTTEKSEKGNFSSSITHPYHTNKETLGSQTFSASNNESETDTSSSLISSSFTNAHASNNRNGFDMPDNQRYSLQKRKIRPTFSQEELQVQGNSTSSSSLKPVPHTKGGNKVNFKAELAACGRTGRTPRDRPILGTVAAHWNEEIEPSPAPLKWWDGNGIPNSTNKYREDQIVSWHATPFEEMLEKALSEENSISQSRKHSSGAHIGFEDEIDTAASQLQSLSQTKSVVSF